MVSLPARSQYPAYVGVFLVGAAVLAMVTPIDATIIQYGLISITIAGSSYRVMFGPDRALFLTIIISVLTLFFSSIGVNFFFPNQPYIVESLTPILSYSSAIITVEIAQHLRIQTTLRNIASVVVLMAVLLFVQLYEGPEFQDSFMFATMHCLLVVWLLGKALEIRPWKRTLPIGLRMLDAGFIFIIMSVFIYTVNLIAPDNDYYQVINDNQIIMHGLNIGLALMGTTALSGWGCRFPEHTLVRFGFAQDITVAFVPLLMGIAGTQTTSGLSQTALGAAAVVSTCILLVDLDSLQKELNRTNASVTAAAVTDTVTMLPNRYALDDYLTDPVVGVTLVDVEGIREVNTTYSFSVGDTILREFAQRLVACVAARGQVLRTSGNEFVILWYGRVLDIESRLRSTIAVPFEIGQDQVYLSLFIGSAADETENPKALLTSAYTAKVKDRQAV